MSDLISQLASAKLYDLEQPRFAGMPSLPVLTPPYAYTLHRRHTDTYAPAQHGPRSGATGMIVTTDHFGTHIDAVCHQADEMKLFGSLAVAPGGETPAGFTQLGAESIPPLAAAPAGAAVGLLFSLRQPNGEQGIYQASLCGESMLAKAMIWKVPGCEMHPSTTWEYSYRRSGAKTAGQPLALPQQSR